MKKYKVPENTKIIYISEEEKPYIFTKELIQLPESEEWQIISKKVYLEEINE